MIKASSGSIYAYIKRITEENGGVPDVFFDSGTPFTYENWLIKHEIMLFELIEDTSDSLSKVCWN